MGTSVHFFSNYGSLAIINYTVAFGGKYAMEHAQKGKIVSILLTIYNEAT